MPVENLKTPMTQGDRLVQMAGHRALLLAALREVQYFIRCGDSKEALAEITKVRGKVKL